MATAIEQDGRRIVIRCVGALRLELFGGASG